MKYYIISHIKNGKSIHSKNIQNAPFDVEYQDSKLFINAAESEEALVSLLWERIENNIWCQQTHSIITSLDDLNAYTDQTMDYGDSTETERNEWVIQTSDLIDSIEFPNEIKTYEETGQLPETERIRELVREKYFQYCRKLEEADKKAKAKKEAEEILKSQEEYKEYLRLKEKFEKPEILEFSQAEF